MRTSTFRRGAITLLLGAAAGCAAGEPGASPALTAIVIDSVSSPAGPGSSEPNLTVARDGRVMLSWVEPAGEGLHALRVAEWRDGVWGETRTVTARADIWLNWADFPTTASLGGSHLAAHWPQRSGDGRYDYDVRIAQSSDGGATWSEGVIPHPGSRRGEHGFVTMGAVNDSLLAVWLDGRGYDTTVAGATRAMSLAARALAPNGGMGPEEIIDARTCDCCQTDMAMTSRGPVVVYRDRTEDEIRDLMIVRREASGWTAPRALHADGWHVDYCPVNGPAVAARGDTVVAAWFTAPNDSAVVRVAFSTDAGDTFGPPVRVDDGAPVGRVDVALLANGSAAVTWLERAGTDGAEVRVRRVSADGRRGDATTIAGSSAARASGFPRMAPAGDGLLFAWTQPGESSTVRAAIGRVP